VADEVGEIIVAEVDVEAVHRLASADGGALSGLIAEA
jgi:hypothetical protein